MYFKNTLPLAMFGFQVTASVASTAQNYTFSFNDMLDGSLGDMPAMWLVAHGALASLNSTKTLLAKRSEDSSAPASTSTAPANRDKDNGAVLGAFIGASLTSPIKLQDSNSKLKALCQTLVAGTTGMAAAVVGQEAGKRIYGTNSTAPDFEEGLIPGTFVGGIVGTVTGTQLTRTLCELGVPGFKELLADLDDLGLGGVERIMGQSYLQALDATLEALGVDPARIVKFSGQIQQGLRFIHLHGPAEGVEQLTRALTRESAELVNAFADGMPLTSPAISALAGFGSLNGAALGLPPITPLPVTGAPALGQLSAITSQLSNVIGFANSLPTILQLSQAQVAADALRDGIAEAAAAPNSGLTGHAKDAIKKAGKLTNGLLDTLDRLRPSRSVCHGKEHTYVVTETHEHTTTATRVQTATTTVHEIKRRTRTMVVEHPAVTVTRYRTVERIETVTATETVTERAEPAYEPYDQYGEPYEPCPYPGQIC